MFSTFGATSRHTVSFAKAYRDEERERSGRSPRAGRRHRDAATVTTRAR